MNSGDVKLCDEGHIIRSALGSDNTGDYRFGWSMGGV